MKDKKESKFAFQEGEKATIATRLRELIGHRSVRAAAQDWGLSFSTLNNYLTRGTEPSLNVAIKISNLESVSVEWLATGANHNCDKKISPSTKNAWLTVLESLDDKEVQALLRTIHKKGVDGIIDRVSHTSTASNSLNAALLKLPLEEKTRLMELHNAKKGRDT
ncbi:hypothetical protein SGGMMB4_01831 [Sodalis glossinidius str. 'morsitans']|uniref:HTH cro/C1-type domain-containing protein n=1 Tax=Sodalis glossinidius (strain morsitans) TaxID=343509 RepID=A0A193QHH4_SODGM|nr:hypothetical protein [Sodalis glossinidius]CRL44632.1 hypothetical protein SGGMMB4_01831 [Sodalis glossinidius str. 'morsitans']